MTDRDFSATISQPVNPFHPVEEKSFYDLPTGAACNLIMETMGAGANIADLPAQKRRTRDKSELVVLEREQARRIILKRPNGDEITLELEDIEKFSGNNKALKKLFIMALIKANEQAIHNGELTRKYITFPLKEFVETGFYATLRSARKGFTDAMDALTSLKIGGKICKTKGKKRQITSKKIRVLFPAVDDIEGNQCTIYLNELVNWEFLIQYYTILPRYYFSLSNRGSDLLLYIFNQARQHTRNIEKQGYFTIGFRAIQTRLHLPDKSNNPQRDIRQPIEDAITEIEDHHKDVYGNTEFSLLPVYDIETNINDFLDRGYLQVTLTGEFAKTFIAISRKTTKRIEAAQKRKDSITEKAIAIKQASKKDTEGDAPTDTPDV